MKSRIIEAISEQHCHLMPSIIGWCVNDYEEMESFIVALTELVQDGVVVYSKPIGNSKYGKYNIK